MLEFRGYCKSDAFFMKIKNDISEALLMFPDSEIDKIAKATGIIIVADVLLHPLKHKDQKASLKKVLDYVKDTCKVTVASFSWAMQA